jgi:polyisoprenoid-binding protein YceI
LGPEIAIQRYAIDKRSSRFSVRAVASGMLSAFGHNPLINVRDVSGEAGFDPAAPGAGFLRMRIRANSLEVAGDIGAKDRTEMERMMNEDVLEVAKYPEIAYESSSVSATPMGEARYRIDINGSLSLHGVTRPQPVSAQVTTIGDTLRAYGEFSLLQTSYDIKPVTVAGGTLKLKDELKFSFDIVARKQG